MTGLRVLEVRCSDGTCLPWIKDNLGADCFGIKLSAEAVAVARTKGVEYSKAPPMYYLTSSQSFDLVIYGFCLYPCDRDDLFRIASEADRVLFRRLIIKDFYSSFPRARMYHHRLGVQNYKMDYRTLFTWHSDYECKTHKVRHHSELGYTDGPEEWVTVSVLRKNKKGEFA